MTSLRKSGNLRTTAVVFAAGLMAGCGGADPGDESAQSSAGSAASAPAAPRLEALTPEGLPFHGVHGMRFDDAGLLHVTSVIGQSIFTVDVDTRAVSLLVGPPEGMADDIAIAPDGTMFWTAIEDGIVYKREPGRAPERFLENVKGANAIAYSPDYSRLFYTQVFYGDALYELDASGGTPPRLISADHGGLNAFEMADDGYIYGPLVFGAAVVRVDPDTGDIERVSEEFDGPSALKLAGNGIAYVLDETHVKRVVLASGETRTVAELSTGGDNLDIGPDGNLYISLAAENAIVVVDPETGTQEYLIGPAALVSPAGISLGGDTLYVGDMMGSLRAIDTATGNIDTLGSAIFQPTHVDARGENLIVVGEVFGEVERVDRETLSVVDRYEGFSIPHDALEAPNGDILVAEAGAGRIVRIEGRAPGIRTVIADGLAEPNGLAWADDDRVYVTETAGNRLLRVTLGSGVVEVLADGLAQPEGVAADPGGGALVMEVGAKRLAHVADDGSVSVVMDDLPIGLSNGPSLYRGLAVSASGELFLTSDVDNMIYRVVR